MTAAAIHRDLRIEPAYPTHTLTSVEQRCLLETMQGDFVKCEREQCFARFDGRGEAQWLVPLAVMDRLIELKLMRRRMICGTGGARVEAHPTGEGAHAIRTLFRRGT